MMPSATVQNVGPGLRVFKNAFNQDVAIQPGDSRSFDMHPHHLRLLDREARKVGSTIKLIADKEVLALVNQPGGNTTEADRRATELYQLQEQQRLARLRREGEELQGMVSDQRYITDPKTVPDEKQPATKQPQTKGPAKQPEPAPSPEQKAEGSSEDETDTGDEIEETKQPALGKGGKGKQDAKQPQAKSGERVKLTK